MGGLRTGLRPDGPLRNALLPQPMRTPPERAGLLLRESRGSPSLPLTTSKRPCQDRTAPAKRPAPCPNLTLYPIG